MFEKDLAESDPVTLEAWQKRSLGLRLKETFAGIWDYWL
jgi:cardiolipin synthase